MKIRTASAHRRREGFIHSLATELLDVMCEGDASVVTKLGGLWRFLVVTPFSAFLHMEQGADGVYESQSDGGRQTGRVKPPTLTVPRRRHAFRQIFEARGAPRVDAKRLPMSRRDP